MKTKVVINIPNIPIIEGFKNEGANVLKFTTHSINDSLKLIPYQFQ